jgi:TRAP-type C4-dicarboxylate transport system permease small subunit
MLKTSPATGIDPEAESEDADAFAPPENFAAHAGRSVSEIITCGLVVMMGLEMVTRTLFGWSIQFSNEIGGYALVAITFLGLASGQLSHAYHRVHFVEHRLSLRGRARLRFGFDAAALASTLVLMLEFIRFAWITWKSGDVAATSLMTPQWMPRVVMPIGAMLLAWALVVIVCADWRRLQATKAGAGHAQ